MKKLFLLLFTVSMTAQVPAIVEVEEWVSDNPKKLVEMLNHWTDLEAEQNGVYSFVLEVIDGNKVYLCRTFDDMGQMIKKEEDRWGDEGWQSKTFQNWDKKYDWQDFSGVNPEKLITHVFYHWEELSYIPEGMNLAEQLPNLKFRRNITMDIQNGDGNWDKFQNQIKAGIENDKKLKNNYVRLMYSPVYGGIRGADFLMIVMDESRASYYNGLAERNKKRDNDDDWKSIQNDNVANWIDEEDIIVHY